MAKVLKRRRVQNPIKNGRVVSDITFATRFKHFLKDIKVSSQIDEEELDYIKMVAENLLEYQIATVKDKDEKEYFKNLGIIV